MFIKKILPLLILLPAMLPLYAAEYQVKTYHGFYADDPEGRDGLRNPERGYRFMTEVGNISPEHRNTELLDWPDQQNRFPQVTLTQAYCWLLPYFDRPIEEEKLVAICRDLGRLRAAGIKVILRVAYERTMPPEYGPTLAVVLAHMEQLKPIFREYDDVLFMVQLGFIGAFGEWHSSANNLIANPAASQVAMKLLEILPPDRMTTIRRPILKRQVLGQLDLRKYRLLGAAEACTGTPKSRIGFANDGFGADPADGGTWPEEPLMANPGNPEFDMFTVESAYLPVDGEMFYRDCTATVDGIWAAARLKLHHYNSLGMYQSHAALEAPGEEFSMDKWKKQMLDPAKFPASDNFYLLRDGSAAPRSAFDYIRDHLGYRLELQKARFPGKMSEGEKLELTCLVINRGFAAPVYSRPVYAVLIDGDGRMNAFPVNTDLRKFQPYRPGDSSFAPLTHQIQCSLLLPEYIVPGTYRLGLWMPDKSMQLRYTPEYALRLANRDVNYEILNGRYGVNILGELQVVPRRAANIIGHWRWENAGAETVADLSAGRVDAVREKDSNGNSYYRLQNSSALDFQGARPYTVMARLKIDHANVTGIVFSRHNAGVVGQLMMEIQQGKLCAQRETQPWKCLGNQALAPGVPHWVAMAYDGTTLRLYVDGQPDGSARFGRINATPELPVLIGASLHQGQPYGLLEGTIYELVIYDRALAPSEISDLYNSAKGP